MNIIFKLNIPEYRKLLTANPQQIPTEFPVNIYNFLPTKINAIYNNDAVYFTYEGPKTDLTEQSTKLLLSNLKLETIGDNQYTLTELKNQHNIYPIVKLQLAAQIEQELFYNREQKIITGQGLAWFNSYEMNSGLIIDEPCLELKIIGFVVI